MAEKKKPSIFEKPKEEPGEDEVSESPEQFLDESEEHTESPEDVELKMRVGDKPVNVYTEEGREELLEEDEIGTWEEGFARGEDEPELAHCAACGKVLSQDESKLVEKEIGHVIRLFCSDKCAQAGVQHGKKQ
jgi:hypothetical protein